MKKNLRRICLLLLAMVMIGKKIFATSTGDVDTTSIFSGTMKFIFAGIALVLLVMILYLSYKLDKEGTLMTGDGKVSKKKLGSSNKNKSKEKSADSPIEDEEFFSNDQLYEENIKPSDFESEEAAGFKDDASEGKIVQKMDDFSDFSDFEEDDENEELKNIDNNSNNIPDYLEDDFNNVANYSEDEEDSDEIEEVSKKIDALDEDDEYSDLNNDITKAIEDLDDENVYDDNYETESDLDNTIEELEDDTIDDVEEKVIEDYEDDEAEDYEDDSLVDDMGDNNEDMPFDTSVLDDIEDFEDTKPTKGLASSSMPKTPKSNRFESTDDSEEIGFRRKPKDEGTEKIGFRNATEEDSSEEIGFRRKNQIIEDYEEDNTEDNKALLDDLDSLEDFDSNDFLNNIDNTMKGSTTTKTASKKKKIDDNDNIVKKSSTTTRKKKI